MRWLPGWRGLGGTLAVAGLVAGVGSTWLAMQRELDLRTAEYRMLQLQTAFVEYRADHGTWPPLAVGADARVLPAHQLLCLVCEPDHDLDWQGPYLPSARLLGEVGAREHSEFCEEFWDPWGQAFQVWYEPRYGLLGSGGGVVLVGAGPDGVVETGRIAAARLNPVGDDLLVPIQIDR